MLSKLFLVVATTLCITPNMAKVIPGKCVMYGECGAGYNCDYQGPAKTIESQRFSDELVKTCGDRYRNVTSTCCDILQLNSLKRSSKYAYNLIGACPACWKNFMDFWCEFTCSPVQSTFVKTTAHSSKTNQVLSVDYFVAPEFGQVFFDSCKSVKFGPNNAFAMDLLGNGAENYVEMMRFMGTPSPFGTPFKIGFPDLRGVPVGTAAANAIRPMNLSTTSCSQTGSYQCSCVDCDASCPPLPPVSEEYNGLTTICRTAGLFASCFSAGLFMLSIALFISLAIIAVCQYFATRKMIRVEISESDGSFSYEQFFPVAGSSEEENDDEHDDGDSRTLIAGAEQRRLRTTTYETGKSSEESWLHNNIFFDYESNFRRYPFQEFLQIAFCKLGYFCARRPWWTIGFSMAIVLFCSIGWYRHFSVETDPLHLWVDPNSQTAKEKEFFDQNFGPFYRVQQIIISLDNQSSIVKQPFIEMLFGVINEINDLAVTSRDNTSTAIKLQDLCFQPLSDGNCAIQSLTGFWQDDISLFRRSISQSGGSFKKALQRCVDTPSSCLPKFQQPINIDLVLGGFQDRNDVFEGRALIVTVLLNNFMEPDKVLLAKMWEDLLVEYFKRKQLDLTSAGVRFSFSTEHSMEMEINRESYTDVPTVAMSYLVMFCYVALALGRYRSFHRLVIDSKATVAICGILIVLGSISAAVGLFSFTGQKVTMIIAEVIPFLVLAIGVDNIFIIIHQYERLGLEQLYQSGCVSLPEERLALSIGRIGPSLMLSALGETLAFALGILIVGMPAVKSFSMIAAISVWIDFCLQVTCFIAILSLDAKRVESRRVDCLPCLKIGSNERRHGERDSTVGELWNDGENNDPTVDDDNWSGNSESILQRVFRKYYAPFLLHPAVKIAVALLFFAAFLVGLINVDRLELGLDQRIALPRGSYLVDYFNDLENYLKVGPPVYFVASNISSKTSAGQSVICSRFTGCSPYSVPNILEQERQRPAKSFIVQPTAGWFDDMMMWLNPAAECCILRNGDSMLARKELCRPPQDIPIFDCHTCLPPDDPMEYNNSLSGLPKQQEFLEYLDLFLQSKPTAECPLGGLPYASAVKRNQGDIVASHFRTFHTLLRSQQEFIDAYTAARRIADSIQAQNIDSGLQVFPYSVFYIFFDQYTRLFELLWSSVALALFAITLSSTLFLGNFRNSVIMTGTILMVVVEMVGLVMYYWQISLNAITLVNCLICLGIAVEFCTHLTRAFTITSPQHPLFDIADGRVVYHNRWLNSSQSANPLPTAASELAIGNHANRLITGTRNRRAFVSLVEMGSTVLSGITMTKFCGIFVLYFAQSRIFEVYYFRMYLGMIVLGVLHSLVLLPVLLSWFGSHNVSRTSSLASLVTAAGIGHGGSGSGGANAFRPYSAITNYVDSSIFDDETTTIA